jgi:hypothetical protein
VANRSNGHLCLYRNPPGHPGPGAHPNSDLPKDDSDFQLSGKVSEAQSAR